MFKNELLDDGVEERIVEYCGSEAKTYSLKKERFRGEPIDDKVEVKCKGVPKAAVKMHLPRAREGRGAEPGGEGGGIPGHPDEEVRAPPHVPEEGGDAREQYESAPARGRDVRAPRPLAVRIKRE